jgi:hypothetical protein
MPPSTLRQALTIFETTTAPLTLPQMARELDISVEQLEAMLQYWVRKGKLRESSGAGECCGCSKSGDCAYVVAMPRSYELASAPTIPLHLNSTCCPSQT